MRDLINLFENVFHREPELDEGGAGPSRIVQHIRDGKVFFMISAMRGEHKHAENLRRTIKMKKMFRELPVVFIETEGEYTELGRDEPSPEKSFFVMPAKGKPEHTAGPFRKFGIKLMHVFDQDSILYGDGRLASLIFENGSTFDLGNTVTFRPEVIKDLGGFSRIKGRTFSFTDASTAGQPVTKSHSVSEPALTKGVTYGQKLDPPEKSAANIKFGKNFNKPEKPDDDQSDEDDIKIA